MNVYVAGSSKDLINVRVVQEMVRQAGHRITYDWTLDVERYGSGVPDGGKGSAERCAECDRKGVLSADVVVVVPHVRMWGAVVEIGMALAHRTPVWFINEWYQARYSVFWELGDCTDVERLDQLRQYLDMRT